MTTQIPISRNTGPTENLYGAQKLFEAGELLSDRAMEMYRLNVLERIGREEGSQIVVYGLGGNDRNLEDTIAATAAGSRLRSQ